MKWLTFLIILSFLSCKSKKLSETLPDCIMERLEKQESGTYADRAQIFQYNYKGRTVYYIPPYMPDAYGDVLDSACTIICHPDGGITGKGDGKCTDFFSTRTNEKLLKREHYK